MVIFATAPAPWEAHVWVAVVADDGFVWVGCEVLDWEGREGFAGQGVAEAIAVRCAGEGGVGVIVVVDGFVGE